MAKKPLYQVLAIRLAWQPSPGSQYAQQKANEIKRLLDTLPSGSGWDCGTKLDERASTPNSIVLCGMFHHMNGVDSYDGWTTHRIIVTPSLQRGCNLRITGQNRNDIRDYLYMLFDQALRQEVDELPPASTSERSEGA